MKLRLATEQMLADAVFEGGGNAGPATSLTIGTVSTGLTASAAITGTAPDLVLSLVLPRAADGDPGDDGKDALPTNLTIGTVTTGVTPSASITGTAPNLVLNMVLPKGEKGDPGTVTDLANLVKTPTAWVTGTAYNVGDYVTRSGAIFLVLKAHTSATAPSTANSEPTTPGADYLVWAAPGNSPGSIVVRSATNEVTFETAYATNAPVAPSALANKAYVDDQISQVTPPPRPCTAIVYIWNGSDWTYRGEVVTAQTPERMLGDIGIFDGNPVSQGGSMPSWGLPNDVHIGG